MVRARHLITASSLPPSYLYLLWQRRRLIRLGVGTSIISSALCTLPLWFASLFTTDLATCATMHSAVPLLSLAGLGYAMASTFEGILIAGGKTLYVARLYAVSPAVTSLTILLFGRMVGCHAALRTAWVAFACFQATRLGAFALGLRKPVLTKPPVWQ